MKESKHMAGLNLLINRTITDKNGKIIKEYKTRQCRSFVQNFLKHLSFAFAHAYTVDPDPKNIDDTGGTGRACVWSAEAANSHLAVEAPATNSNYGIRIGTGTTPPTVTDHTLETPIAHGAGATQMEHGATSVGDPSEAAGTVSFSITRAFVNNSGGTIVVKEVGLIIETHNTWYFLLLKDAVSDSVAHGQTYTVTYTLQTVF